MPSERRYHPLARPLEVKCRLCFTPVVLAPEGFDRVDLFVFYRCPQCNGAFRVRNTDVAEAGDLGLS